jgi:hypothetical protein
LMVLANKTSHFRVSPDLFNDGVYLLRRPAGISNKQKQHESLLGP